MKIMGLALMSLLLCAAAPAFAVTHRLLFVGAPNVSFRFESRDLLNLSYMTASQMQAKVEQMSGFRHPGFADFAAIFGEFDARTGLRTNDRPTVMSVMVMEQLAGDVGDAVYERESFLDDADRIMFRGISLDTSPTESELPVVAGFLCAAALGKTCPAELTNVLITEFRSRESALGLPEAWAGLVAAILQNGLNYYY